MQMPEYSRMFRIVFDYQKKYAPFPPTLDAWNAAITEANEICRQDLNNRFLLDMIAAVFTEFENQYRKQQG